MDFMKELWTLFVAFFRIGAFTFGGGLAMLPMIQKEIVEKHQWATDKEVMDYYAIGQCTPGIIAVNTATFIGYKRKGVIGAVVATAGLVCPSLIIITTIAMSIEHFQFQNNPTVKHAFEGIRIAVVALIANTVSKLFKASVKDWLGMLIFGTSFVTIAFLKLAPTYAVIASALLGIIAKKVRTGES